ncbi:hypothetical protein Q4485_12490 [Granulosicoccaceae sp. 1_MG-2023]|nr:hypothetical protein [Granulosicoccaceae sp. 1_MG-2023]
MGKTKSAMTTLMRHGALAAALLVGGCGGGSSLPGSVDIDNADSGSSAGENASGTDSGSNSGSEAKGNLMITSYTTDELVEVNLPNKRMGGTPAIYLTIANTGTAPIEVNTLWYLVSYTDQSVSLENGDYLLYNSVVKRLDPDADGSNILGPGETGTFSGGSAIEYVLYGERYSRVAVNLPLEAFDIEDYDVRIFDSAEIERVVEDDYSDNISEVAVTEVRHLDDGGGYLHDIELFYSPCSAYDEASEDNDSPATAVPIEVGERFSSTIACDWRDFFRVELVKGAVYEVDHSYARRVHMQIRSPDGEVLLDGHPYDFEFASPATGEFIVSVYVADPFDLMTLHNDMPLRETELYGVITQKY